MTNTIYKTEEGRKTVLEMYIKALANWPVPHKEQTVKTRLGDTFVVSFGAETAPALVLLHGASSNSAAWAGEAHEYCKQFHVYAIDVIGEPGNSAPARPPWEEDAYALWLSDVLGALRIQNPMILGISQGGWIALKYAVANPGAVKKLVLLSPGGIVPTKPSFIFAAIFYTLFGRWGAERLNRYVFGGTPIHEEVLKFMNAVMTHVIPRIDKEYIFSDKELSRLGMPILFIGGEKDVIRDNGMIKSRLSRFANKLKTILLPKRGHVLIEVTNLVIPFLLAK